MRIAVLAAVGLIQFLIPSLPLLNECLMNV